MKKSSLIKKFIKKIKYSRDEIAVTAYYRENPGEEIAANDAGGWVRAATGKTENPKFGKKVFTNIGRENSYESSDWLHSSDSLQTIKIVLTNTIHGCKRKNLKHLK